MEGNGKLTRSTPGSNGVGDVDARYWAERPVDDSAYDNVHASDWRDTFAGLLRYKWLILLCAVAGAWAGDWFAGRKTPQYSAAAVLRVAAQPKSNLPILGVKDGTGELPTELELLRSRAMARAVADSLGVQSAADDII